MTDFRKFSSLVRSHFDSMSNAELFVVDITGDELYQAYLNSYPVGTNEIYRTRQEFDCSADKNFVRNLGNVVTIIDNQIITVWDIYNEAEYPFNIVSETLASLIRSKKVISLYRTKEQSYGIEIARELQEDGKLKNWYNFYAKVNRNQISSEPEKVRGDFNTKVKVFQRGLTELTTSALTSVKELINSDMLYRGSEHKKKVQDFAKLHAKYQKLNSDESRNNFIWENAKENAAYFKNDVIGTLVEDLSKDVDLETAVKKFEAKVAPQNYKRSKSLITPNMIRDATKTIADLGLETALQRRFAKISDVTVNNVLFVDNTVRGQMKGGIEELLLSTVKGAPVKLENAIDISIDKFLETVVNQPKTSIEVLVKNSMQGNFMSLTAPQHDEVERMFKWNNNFAWSYDGNITDSGIKEKVALAGGNVTNAALRISLAWSNFDDLDIHVIEPNKNEVCFHNKGGKLDVDMNAGGSRSREPVENVSYTKANLRDGIYKVYVKQYAQREAIDVGYTIEVESASQLQQFFYPRVASGKKLVIDIKVTNGKVEKITPSTGIESTTMSKDKWNIKTETLVPVDTIILSPNYWDDQEIGNKHWFFILKDCFNPESTRGIYNEFLRNDLDKHRKVFEILGDKTKCAPDQNESQLSGLGFSSTKRNDLTAVVKSGNTKRVYNIKF